RDAGPGELAVDVLADLHVPVQRLRVVLARVPLGLPRVDHAEPESVRINLVSHRSPLPTSPRPPSRGWFAAGSGWPVPARGGGTGEASDPRRPRPGRRTGSPGSRSSAPRSPPPSSGP